MAGNYQDLRDDIDDLKNDIWANEMYRRLDKLNEQNVSNTRQTYKRKYFNGICRLQWVNGFGLIEIPGEIKGQAIYLLESEDVYKQQIELYIDKSSSKKSVEVLIRSNREQIRKMCK